MEVHREDRKCPSDNFYQCTLLLDKISPSLSIQKVILTCVKHLVHSACFSHFIIAFIEKRRKEDFSFVHCILFLLDTRQSMQYYCAILDIFMLVMVYVMFQFGGT